MSSQSLQTSLPIDTAKRLLHDAQRRATTDLQGAQVATIGVDGTQYHVSLPNTSSPETDEDKALRMALTALPAATVILRCDKAWSATIWGLKAELPCDLQGISEICFYFTSGKLVSADLYTSHPLQSEQRNTLVATYIASRNVLTSKLTTDELMRFLAAHRLTEIRERVLLTLSCGDTQLKIPGWRGECPSPWLGLLVNKLADHSFSVSGAVPPSGTLGIFSQELYGARHRQNSSFVAHYDANSQLSPKQVDYLSQKHPGVLEEALEPATHTLIGTQLSIEQCILLLMQEHDYEKRKRDISFTIDGTLHCVRAPNCGKSRYDTIMALLLKNTKELSIIAEFPPGGKIQIFGLNCEYPAWGGYPCRLDYNQGKLVQVTIFARKAIIDGDNAKVLTSFKAEEPLDISPTTLSLTELIAEVTHAPSRNREKQTILTVEGLTFNLDCPRQNSAVYVLLQNKLKETEKCIIERVCENSRFSFCGFTYALNIDFLRASKGIRLRVSLEHGEITSVAIISSDLRTIAERSLKPYGRWSSPLSTKEIISLIHAIPDYEQRPTPMSISIDSETFEMRIPRSGSTILDEVLGDRIRSLPEVRLGRFLTAAGCFYGLGVQWTSADEAGRYKTLTLRYGKIVA
jgi:hypothetical protein